MSFRTRSGIQTNLDASIRWHDPAEEEVGRLVYHRHKKAGGKPARLRIQTQKAGAKPASTCGGFYSLGEVADRDVSHAHVKTPSSVPTSRDTFSRLTGEGNLPPLPFSGRGGRGEGAIRAESII
ncbi:MAG: hypothetical protein CO189_00240 [candidate division Zixibacteria bacterium CG_4_9_14_3_um_filter_46_8]|nr:MAG: hypothetical protein CO189_00240 [candidate division Zixibacteria bacterium CG_4_9_14_3_um_filter_46_8]